MSLWAVIISRAILVLVEYLGLDGPCLGCMVLKDFLVSHSFDSHGIDFHTTAPLNPGALLGVSVPGLGTVMWQLEFCLVVIFIVVLRLYLFCVLLPAYTKLSISVSTLEFLNYWYVLFVDDMAYTHSVQLYHPTRITSEE